MRPPGPCPAGGPHRPDPASGWCTVARCGWRIDGQSEYSYDPNYTDAQTLPLVDITEPRRKVDAP